MATASIAAGRPGWAARAESARLTCWARQALALLLVIAGLGVAQAGTEQIGNGSFEAGTSGWAVSGAVIRTDTAAVGDQSLGLSAWDSRATYTLASAVPVDDIESLSLWAKNAALTLNLVTFGYSDGSTGSAWLENLDNELWTSYELGSALSAGQLLSSFTVYGNSAALTYLDGVSLQVSTAAPVPEPLTAALFLAGLGALGLAQRLKRTPG